MRYEPTDGRGPSFSIGVWSLRCLRRLGLKKTLNEALETFKLVNTRNVTTHFLFRAHYPKSYISPCYSLISFLSQLTSTATPFFNPQKEAEQAKSNLEASVVLPLYYHLYRPTYRQTDRQFSCKGNNLLQSLVQFIRPITPHTTYHIPHTYHIIYIPNLPTALAYLLSFMTVLCLCFCGPLRQVQRLGQLVA
ncbi:uncharacterized protein GGS25DRAFT_426342 [Hypoxylon fragiforme]|uniref:uncharacterized protein n=1 Tax=Hypoxylon fragiforme TaxID=63214 RepID=UPI0020C73188|nr:uncharacterized protein GGS25DRAFT_426342 [Hypoxylon fragiforme]KAI2605333.1 hypothetical protein GGS25DRAFT_426342 [Hypoxylon fragiforme]